MDSYTTDAVSLAKKISVHSSVTISAVVAVFDMKFVITQQRINTTNVSMYGDG